MGSRLSLKRWIEYPLMRRSCPRAPGSGARNGIRSRNSRKGAFLRDRSLTRRRLTTRSAYPSGISRWPTRRRWLWREYRGTPPIRKGASFTATNRRASRTETLEEAAEDLVQALLPEWTEAEQDDQVKSAMRYFNEFGLTSAISAAVDPATLRAHRRVRRAGGDLARERYVRSDGRPQPHDDA